MCRGLKNVKIQKTVALPVLRLDILRPGTSRKNKLISETYKDR